MLPLLLASSAAAAPWSTRYRGGGRFNKVRLPRAGGAGDAAVHAAAAQTPEQLLPQPRPLSSPPPDPAPNSEPGLGASASDIATTTVVAAAPDASGSGVPVPEASPLSAPVPDRNVTGTETIPDAPKHDPQAASSISAAAAVFNTLTYTQYVAPSQQYTSSAAAATPVVAAPWTTTPHAAPPPPPEPTRNTGNTDNGLAAALYDEAKQAAESYLAAMVNANAAKFLPTITLEVVLSPTADAGGIHYVAHIGDDGTVTHSVRLSPAAVSFLSY